MTQWNMNQRAWLGAAPPWVLCGALAFSLVSFDAAPSGATTSSKAPPVIAAQKTQGRFSLLTYNVAGLPEFLSQSDPVRNIPVISGLLNLYDVAFVQEDFAYHAQLVARALHPYRTEPVIQNERTGIGDGLGIFSRIPFSGFQRITWASCFGKLSDGSDCLAPKGFTVSVHEVAPGVEIDMYNLHMDSGGAPGDVLARSEQTTQLLAFIEQRSKGRPVVVAGDMNTKSDTDAVLEAMYTNQGLSDACRSLRCKQPRLFDRVLFRGSKQLELRAVSFLVDGRFVQKDGRDLSDHKAVGVHLEWRRTALSDGDAAAAAPRY